MTDADQPCAKRAKRSDQYDGLLVPVARIKYGDGRTQDVTPDQWFGDDLKETRNRLRRDVALCCPDGCVVCAKPYRDGCRPHFAHVHGKSAVRCGYVRKYGGKGESPEHLSAKLRLGVLGADNCTGTLVFEQVCGNARECGTVTRAVRVPSTWTYRTEYAMTMADGRTITVDGAFFEDGARTIVRLVAEVEHTHGTEGAKRDWLRTQAFDYVEVGAAQVNGAQDGRVRIIDAEGAIPECEACVAQDIVECEGRIKRKNESTKPQHTVGCRHNNDACVRCGLTWVDDDPACSCPWICQCPRCDDDRAQQTPKERRHYRAELRREVDRLDAELRTVQMDAATTKKKWWALLTGVDDNADDYDAQLRRFKTYDNAIQTLYTRMKRCAVHGAPRANYEALVALEPEIREFARTAKQRIAAAAERARACLAANERARAAAAAVKPDGGAFLRMALRAEASLPEAKDCFRRVNAHAHPEGDNRSLLKAQMETLRQAWVRSAENRELCRRFPQDVVQTGKAKKMHVALALAYYPHWIHWAAGLFDNAARRWIDDHRRLHGYAQTLWETFGPWTPTRNMWAYAPERARFAMLFTVCIVAAPPPRQGVPCMQRSLAEREATVPRRSQREVGVPSSGREDDTASLHRLMRDSQKGHDDNVRSESSAYLQREGIRASETLVQNDVRIVHPHTGETIRFGLKRRSVQLEGTRRRVSMRLVDIKAWYNSRAAIWPNACPACKTTLKITRGGWRLCENDACAKKWCGKVAPSDS